MKKGINHVRKEPQTAKGIIMGIVLFAILQFAFIALISSLILNDSINEQSAIWILPAVTILSAFVGGFVTLKNRETGKLQTAIALAGILIIIVLLTALVLNGNLLSTWKCDGCILIGIGLTLIVRPKMKVRKKRIKVHL